MDNNSIERLGVSKLESYFSSLGWLFREQHVSDYGIDAQVEIVVDDNPTGELIALQIKSGLSYFSETTSDAIIFRTNDKHSYYWVKHCLPVILALYNPDGDCFYWESITEETFISTGEGWKINVPKNKVLKKDSISELRTLINPSPYIQRLNKLRLDKKWIELVANEDIVYIEFQNWINKSLPRFSITIGCQTRSDINKETWPTIYGCGLSIDTFLSNVIPWAEFEMDEDAYLEHVKSIWYEECRLGYDKELDKAYFSEPFSQWYSSPCDIEPCYSDGEVEGYRLLLSLNSIGKSFLLLDDFLSHEDDFGDYAFTL